MKVPNHIVLEGASMLKSSIAVHVMNKGLPAAEMGAALIILDEILDFSMCRMSDSYVAHSQQRARTEEAFRHLALGQDLIVERETQRAALMEWSHSVLFALLGSEERRDVRKLSASPFGLWLRHRAGLLFPDSPVVEDIESSLPPSTRRICPPSPITCPVPSKRWPRWKSGSRNCASCSTICSRSSPAPMPGAIR
jgi:diguanylate cyclase